RSNRTYLAMCSKEGGMEIERVRAFHGQLLDLHSAFLGAHGHVGAVGAVEEDGEVVLLCDVGTLGDHHLFGDVALDVESQDVLGTCFGLVGVLGHLDAAGLPAATDLDLRLHDDGSAAEGLGGRLRFFWRRRDLGLEHGYSVLLEQVTCLILEKIHVYSFALTAGWFAPCRLVDGCNNQGQPYSQTHPWLQTSRLMGPSSVRNVSSKSIFVVKILDMDVNLIHGR